MNWQQVRTGYRGADFALCGGAAMLCGGCSALVALQFAPERLAEFSLWPQIVLVFALGLIYGPAFAAGLSAVNYLVCALLQGRFDAVHMLFMLLLGALPSAVYLLLFARRCRRRYPIRVHSLWRYGLSVLSIWLLCVMLPDAFGLGLRGGQPAGFALCHGLGLVLMPVYAVCAAILEQYYRKFFTH